MILYCFHKSLKGLLKGVFEIECARVSKGRYFPYAEKQKSMISYPLDNPLCFRSDNEMETHEEYSKAMNEAIRIMDLKLERSRADKRRLEDRKKKHEQTQQ